MEKIEAKDGDKNSTIFAMSLKDYQTIDSTDKCEHVLGFIHKRLDSNLCQLLSLLCRMSASNPKGFGVPYHLLLSAFEATSKCPMDEYELTTLIAYLKMVKFIRVVEAVKKSTQETEFFFVLNHEMVGKWAEEKVLNIIEGDERYKKMMNGIAEAAKRNMHLADDYERIN